MNVHHLELFYYVAKHGGIMPAVRNIPYGIQQPAVSSQVLQLEEFLGVTLFHRRPFALTGEGEKLFQFIQPFFGNLNQVADELRGGRARLIRIGASSIVLREHLPGLLQSVRKKFSGLRVALREGDPTELGQWLEEGDLDLAVTLIEKKMPAGFHSLKLIELPLVLLVEKNSAIASVEELWERDRIAEPLICLPQAESITKIFQEQLRRRAVDWFPTIEASSAELIEAYVGNGLGIGVSVAIPGKALSPEVRALPLAGFPQIVIGVLWRGRMTPLRQAFLEEIKSRAKKFA
jgi:DNA-binding transcriptional LysR family regulator